MPRYHRMPRLRDTALAEFLREEATGGIALALGTCVALVWANAAGASYDDLWSTKLNLGLELDLRHWVNDGLMAIFFFVVGLEIKRELVVGELSDRRAAALPVIAAAGGVIVPALLFTAVTAGTDVARGWAIPAATDIAFAVGVLALLGPRIPAGVKLFLLTIAIVDDIAAIALIAIFYADGVSALWLLASAASVGAVVALRRAGVTAIGAYVLAGFVLWVAVHESGVHATIAGVVLGILTPTGKVAGREVLEEIEHRMHPFSALAIVPVFALANAGVGLGGDAISAALESRVVPAIVVGLVLGKLLGIAGATFLGLRMGWGTLPEGVSNAHVWGVAALGGIGFTVSLFIASLAYDDAAVIDAAKIGILAGSLLSGVLGYVLLARQRASS